MMMQIDKIHTVIFRTCISASGIATLKQAARGSRGLRQARVVRWRAPFRKVPAQSVPHPHRGVAGGERRRGGDCRRTVKAT